MTALTLAPDLGLDAALDVLPDLEDFDHIDCEVFPKPHSGRVYHFGRLPECTIRAKYQVATTCEANGKNTGKACAAIGEFMLDLIARNDFACFCRRPVANCWVVTPL